MKNSTPGKFRGWHMVALAFLGQNLGLGLSGAAFGVILQDLQEKFELTRGMVSLAVGFKFLALALSAPLIASLTARITLRMMMIAGAAIQAAAYFLMAMATNFTEILIGYAFVGLGSCLFAVIAPITLVSRWFEADRGKALGIINVPLLIFITPPIAGMLATAYGSTGVFLAIGSVLAAAVPLMFFVVDRPEQIGQTPRTSDAVVANQPAATTATNSVLTNRDLLVSWQFGLLTLGLGFLIGTGPVFMVHIVPFAMQMDLSLASASLLVSAFGGAGLVGTVLCGWLADKIGAVRGLCLTAIALAFGWGALLMAPNLIAMLVVAGFIGILTTAVAAIHGSAVNEIFGKENVPKVIGLTYFFKMPFLFGFPVLAGYLFDVTGGYQLPFVLQILGFLVAAAGFAIIARFPARAPHIPQVVSA